MRRSRKLLLFFVIFQIIVVAACLYRVGGALGKGFGRSLSVKFYNGVLNVYLPALAASQKEGGSGFYYDWTAAMYPALAANEKMLWYESQAEEAADYETLAVLENESIRQAALENRQAKAGADGGEASDAEPEAVAAAGQKPKKAEGQKVEEEVNKTLADAGGGETVSGTGAKKNKVNRKKLEDFDYLLQHFYQVDNTTTIGSDRLNARKLLSYDLTVEKKESPQILIYHTHSQEGFADSVAGDSSTTVVGLGDRLTELLTERGYTVLHDTGAYDLPSRDRAYSVAAPYIQDILAANPDIEVVIDLHRDGVQEGVHLLSEQNGKKMAQIMFFNGLSHTTAAGDIAYLKNPYIEDNLAFSLQMQIAAAENYPGLARRIYLKGYRFNMHFVPKSLLVEVGAQTNTVQEAKNAMEPLADILDLVLSGEKEQ